jgi:hypothetical protein
VHGLRALSLISVGGHAAFATEVYRRWVFLHHVHDLRTTARRPAMHHFVESCAKRTLNVERCAKRRSILPEMTRRSNKSIS